MANKKEIEVKIKPGLKTTEFYAALVAILVVAVGAEVGLDMNIETVTGVVATAITYIVARVITKKTPEDK